mmetsp:Transcript_143185/g.457464  ORF Transcript_143185/g.457464 Transcript_143185/m.457464 type:complete len:240 (+) Transcript_143185:538-1257(+)
MEPPHPLLLNMPELAAHLMILRSESSTYCGFCSKKESNHSKVPSSGKPTGRTTSYFPSLPSGAFALMASASAAAPSMRHLKGSALIGSGPQFVSTLTLRKARCGKSVFPWRPSGKACGWQARTPSMNKLMVLLFSLLASKFSRTPTVWSRKNFLQTGFLVLPMQQPPSVSKKTCSSLSPSTSGEPAVEKPTRTMALLAGAPLRPKPPASGRGKTSKILVSNMYLPAFMPTFARAPAMRY